MYLCVYGYISDISLLYYWIFDISLYISLLFLRSHFMPKIIITPKGVHLLTMGTINDLLILNSNLMAKH
jgi:hypothetical protein